MKKHHRGLFGTLKNKNFYLLAGAAILILFGLVFLWLASFKIPDISTVEQRKVVQGTKIYDRTGKVLLYDVFEDIKRATVPLDKISFYLRNATVAIEDSSFYQHHGIRPTSILRSVLANLTTGSFGQGGSTITQQVVKNTILTKDKTITRKLKEWFLAVKLEQVLTKEQILELYLNENPYGGTIYGVQEASKTYFGKDASDLTLAESAYLAALPQAPTYYSPYGNNKDKLEERKNLVLDKMVENKFITQDEANTAKKEKVEFKTQEKTGIKAPHFVEYVKQYLEQKYGQSMIQDQGLKVITTLDYDLQKKAEEILKKYALDNKEKFNAENAALVAIDPKTGQILAMVGSRDYFDKAIDGNFNVAIAHRQPGSTFKPFVYATAFNKGYTPDTVLFDVPTEFQSTCDPLGQPKDASTKPEDCYMPENYDGLYVGPISLRNALAQSRNVPAIKTLYLAGIKESIQTARTLGIQSLGTPDNYGLTLVLGGGEVSLLEMTGAYGVFANSGVRNITNPIIKIENANGDVIESFNQNSDEVLNKQTALEISDILSDNKARTPAYGPNSVLYFPGRDVAVKTGTTNDYKDAWIIGYTPNIVVGTWAGNNNNTPMEKKVAGQIVAPMWNAVMKEVLKTVPDEKFEKPTPVNPNSKPILRGFWQGDQTYTIDIVSGKLATDQTPEEYRQEKSIVNVHSVLYWIRKSDPLGDRPENPADDSQFLSWEFGVQNWLSAHPQASSTPPTDYDSIHTTANQPKISIAEPVSTSVYEKTAVINPRLSINAVYPIKKVEYYLDGVYAGSSEVSPFSLNIKLSERENKDSQQSELRAVVYDQVGNKSESSVSFGVK
jgi:1A family penicillin-binding protein